MLYLKAKIIISCEFEPEKRRVTIKTVSSTIENPATECGFQDYMLEWEDTEHGPVCDCWILDGDENFWQGYGCGSWDDIPEPTVENFSEKKDLIVRLFATKAFPYDVLNCIDFFDKNFIQK